MQGVLLLAHGSRAEAARQTMEAVAALVARRLPNLPVQAAYMELCEPNIAAGLDLLVAQGVDDIRVAPYFLFDGIHIQEDIPAELAAYRAAHPEINIILCPTLGADERLAEIVAERIKA